MRHTNLRARQLDLHTIEGFERRLGDQGGLSRPAADGLYKELIEIRAIGRELLSHINFLEEAAAIA